MLAKRLGLRSTTPARVKPLVSLTSIPRCARPACCATGLPIRGIGLAITQVIYDQIESIVTGDSDDMADLQAEIVEEVASMLPQ